MADFGISTDSIPMFLGNECLVGLVKILRLNVKDIHYDKVITQNSIGNTYSVEQRNNEFNQYGWITISNELLPINDLFGFVGYQLPDETDTGGIIKPFKFRHFNNQTQVRVTLCGGRKVGFAGGLSISSIPSKRRGDFPIEIFIYQRLSRLTPNVGYGIHIYDKDGNLKYKDGLKILNNIQLVKISDLNDLHTIGHNKIVLNSHIAIRHTCDKRGNSYFYDGRLYSPCMFSNGKVGLAVCDGFTIVSHRRSYPSQANGGEYDDVNIITPHLLIIDKPI